MDPSSKPIPTAFHTMICNMKPLDYFCSVGCYSSVLKLCLKHKGVGECNFTNSNNISIDSAKDKKMINVCLSKLTKFI